MAPELPPGKRLPQGKAAQSKKQASRPLMPNRNLSTEITTRTRSIWSPSPSPEPEVTRPVLLPKPKNASLNRRNGRKANSKLPQSSTSQPVAPTFDLGGQDEEGVKVKKRKLTRTFSEKREKSAGAYSTPDSSPPGPRSATSFSRAGSSTAPNVESPAKMHAKASLTDADMKRAEEPRIMRVSARPSQTTSKSIRSTVRTRKKILDIPLRVLPKKTEGLVNSAILKKPSPVHAKTTSHEGPKRKRLMGALGAQSDESASTSEASPAPAINTSQQGYKRKRLIDALGAQTEESASTSEEDDGEKEKETAEASSSQSSMMKQNDPSLSIFSPSQQPMPTQSPKPSRRIAMNPRRMYGEQRSHLADNKDSLLDGIGLGGKEGPLGLKPGGMSRTSSAIDAFSLVHELDETGNAGAVQSLHELRQAGANSRFGDEMDDIFERIGSPSARPSSLRRGALLELSQKIHNTDFQKHFRDHRCSSNLKRLEDETDIISAFCITAIIVVLLERSGSAGTASTAHLIRQLASNGVADLLGRLLRETTDIARVASDRKQNLPKSGQATLTAIKASMMQLKVWDSALPSAITPRTLALKCLDLLHHQVNEPESEVVIFTPAMTDILFSILDGAASDPECWEMPQQSGSVDFHLALSMLLARSIPAMQSELGSGWTSSYAPIVARVLKAALQRPPQQFDKLESMTFGIALNFANKNSSAAGLFANQGLLLDSAQAACAGFEHVLKSNDGLEGSKKLRDSLILILGVMINLCEHYRPALKTMSPVGRSQVSPLSRLIRVFAKYGRMEQTNSLEASHLRVAVGYLAILLGYLCLDKNIRKLFNKIHPMNSTEPLVESIRQFTIIYSTIVTVREHEGSKRDMTFAERMGKLIAELTNQDHTRD